VTQDPVPAAVRYPAEALDVHVKQFARPLADVADGHAGQPIGMGEPAQTVATQDAVHGRARMPEQWTEARRSDTESAASQEDPSTERRQLGRTMEHESPPSVWSINTILDITSNLEHPDYRVIKLLAH
jgi:hypothetical protein